MTPLAQIHVMAKDKLDTLGMYVSMLSALSICAYLIAGVLCLWSPFTGKAEVAQAILFLLGAIFIGWIRDCVRKAVEKQQVRYDDLTAQLQEERATRGGGLLI